MTLPKPYYQDGAVTIYHGDCIDIMSGLGAESFQIAPTDLLFVDSCHEYPHVAKELLQERYVKRFIIMHDVSPMWIGGFGPLRAMAEFLDSRRNWRLLEFHDNCNGLAVLERLN